jgi:hypothetical protein
MFDKLSNAYAECHSPAEHNAVDKIIVHFKGRIIFEQYIPKKHKLFGTTIYKLCDFKEYTRDIQM